MTYMQLKLFANRMTRAADQMRRARHRQECDRSCGVRRRFVCPDRVDTLVNCPPGSPVSRPRADRRSPPLRITCGSRQSTGCQRGAVIDKTQRNSDNVLQHRSNDRRSNRSRSTKDVFREAAQGTLSGENRRSHCGRGRFEACSRGAKPRAIGRVGTMQQP
jgi:hypothetical protein